MSMHLSIHCSTKGCADMLTSGLNVGVDKDYIDVKRQLIKEWINLGGTFNEADNTALCPPCRQGYTGSKEEPK
jgi:hypothetical protein